MLNPNERKDEEIEETGSCDGSGNGGSNENSESNN